MPNILIAGAASGIGKAFVVHYLKDSANEIHAIDRNFQTPSSAISFDKTSGNGSNLLSCDSSERLHLYTLDITNADQIISQLSQVQDLDLVIHSAGVRGLEPSVPISRSEDVAIAESMELTTAETMLSTININAIGTFVLLRALASKMRRNTSRKAKVLVMGSRMGSIGHNSTGGGYAYRASKAALNAIVKSFSIDVPEVLWCIVHPGRVESGLVAVKEKGAVDAEESVRDIVVLIEGLGVGDEESGSFIDRFGGRIVW